ncbi:MAG: protein-glutamate O-methyltransferase CheR, partial [Campylobacterales bacterium]|nr:protein-glutamate O-methyltransferase CheR [Campylobacterales bacterium]
MDIPITKQEFELFQDYIYNNVGINLPPHKITLVQSRLRKRVKELGLKSYGELFEVIKKDRSGDELAILISSISTNVTSFFREKGQWDFLKTEILNIIKKKNTKRLRIWSAGCSSGQEPYTVAMFLHETLQNISSCDIKILATDISEKVLKLAIEGEYREKDILDLDRNLVHKYFEPMIDKKEQRVYRIKDFLKK